MGSGSETDDGFVIRTPNLLYGEFYTIWSHIRLQDDVDDRQLRHRDHQMKSGTKTDDGFVIRTPNLLHGASFRQFGAIFAPKTTLMTINSDTATTR